MEPSTSQQKLSCPEPVRTKPDPNTIDLPKLSPSEFRQYNRLADRMNAFHNHFRHTWQILYTACEKTQRPQGTSIRQFLRLISDFISQLTMHHTIEEQHVFPALAQRMPAFAPRADLIAQHEKIHEGLEELERWVGECMSGEREVRWEELKKILDGFGDVLWAHLDAEVEMLGAEHMRRYWSLEELKRLPM